VQLSQQAASLRPSPHPRPSSSSSIKKKRRRHCACTRLPFGAGEREVVNSVHRPPCGGVGGLSTVSVTTSDELAAPAPGYRTAPRLRPALHAGVGRSTPI